MRIANIIKQLVKDCLRTKSKSKNINQTQAKMMFLKLLQRMIEADVIQSLKLKIELLNYLRLQSEPQLISNQRMKNLTQFTQVPQNKVLKHLNKKDNFLLTHVMLINHKRKNN